MIEYGKFTAIKPTHVPLLSNARVKEVKEARKRLLERVEQRRAENYIRLLKKSDCKILTA